MTALARVGATLPEGAELLGLALGQMLEAELVEPHGPIEIRVFGRAEAARALLEMGIDTSGRSPAATFLLDHLDGVLVVAYAEEPG